MAHDEVTETSVPAPWVSVRRELEAEIAEGKLRPGAKLPIEPELAERFGVGRHTIRRAIADLADRGVVRVRQGSGTYVNDGLIQYSLNNRTRFSEIVARQNRSASGRLISEGRLGADNRVAYHLNVAAGSPCIFLETLQLIDEAPMSLVTHIFPAVRFQGIVEAYRETGSISLALERFDTADYARRMTVLTASMPDVRDARLLKILRQTPVIITESINVDRNGTPIEYGLGRSSPLQLQFVVQT